MRTRSHRSWGGAVSTPPPPPRRRGTTWLGSRRRRWIGGEGTSFRTCPTRQLRRASPSTQLARGARCRRLRRRRRRSRQTAAGWRPPAPQPPRRRRASTAERRPKFLGDGGCGGRAGASPQGLSGSQTAAVSRRATPPPPAKGHRSASHCRAGRTTGHSSSGVLQRFERPPARPGARPACAADRRARPLRRRGRRGPGGTAALPHAHGLGEAVLALAPECDLRSRMAAAARAGAAEP